MNAKSSHEEIPDMNSYKIIVEILELFVFVYSVRYSEARVDPSWLNLEYEYAKIKSIVVNVLILKQTVQQSIDKDQGAEKKDA